MCGIFGVISTGNNIDVNSLKRVSSSIKHRGPDDEGYLLVSTEEDKLYPYKGDVSPANLNLTHINTSNNNFNLAFIHRRLSIIDLSPQGHQPMSYENENFWIVLNGEIYNYVEIKKELALKGYQFISSSDTEVVLAAYAEWGEKCSEKFNGMWAFAIWDRRKQSLFLSRDRVGIKPLYYYQFDDYFVFCSEIKGILAFVNKPISLNTNKLREFLIKGQIIIGESENTVFHGVKQLLPGHNLLFSNFECKITKYWELNISISKESRIQHIEKFSELFQDSLQLMLRSDVEVGSCLSGGIDSSSIVSYASSKFNKQFNTFSAIWPGTRHDEYKYMELVNNQYHCKTNYIHSNTEDIIKLIDEITWHQEIPLAGSSLIAQWNIMKKAREINVPVLLDGQGADEILSGYPFYLVTYINELIHLFKIKPLLNFLQNSEHTGYNLLDLLKLQINRTLIKQPIQPLLPIREYEQSKYVNSLKFQHPDQANFLPLFLKEHILKSNLPSLLHFEDRNSMAHSIEARVPYLDHRLIEYCINIPSEQKIGNGFTKTILRDAMKGYVPNEILNRRDKIGFSTPIEDNLKIENNELKKYIENQLVKSELWHSDLIDKTKVSSNNLLSLYFLERFIIKFN